MTNLGCFTKGDAFSLPIELNNPTAGFVWTNAVVASNLKQSPNSTTSIFSFSPILNFTSSGILNIVLTGNATQTNTWPLGKLYGDLVVEKSGSFGPYTVAPFYLTLNNRVTNY